MASSTSPTELIPVIKSCVSLRGVNGAIAFRYAREEAYKFLRSKDFKRRTGITKKESVPFDTPSSSF